VPASGPFGDLIGVIEPAGGLLLIIGLAVRPTAVALAGNMTGATVGSGIHLGGLGILTLAPAEPALCLFRFARDQGSRR
jgi:uncharacterized membrane protein YphA (DoxX/SURF4 family)